MHSSTLISGSLDVRPPRYFVTDTTDLKNVRAAPASTFKQLVSLYIERPAALPVDQATFLAMDETERWKMIAPAFIIPATFNLRKSDEGSCNLIILKIETRSEAALFLRNPGEFVRLLKGWNFRVYRSPLSTADNPCFIVITEADSIPQARYSSAVRTLARALRLKTIGDACLNPLTAFPLPVSFQKSPFNVSEPWLQ